MSLLRVLLPVAALLSACIPVAESHAPLEAIPTQLPATIPADTLTPTFLPATPTLPPSTPTVVIPSLTPYPADTFFSIGQSLEGRSLDMWQFGDGETTIVLVGGIHGGYEANSVVLTELLVGYFRDNPQDVLPGMRLALMPTANPDGMQRGDGLDGRFNARGVDLNRNWGCDWSEEAFLRDIKVNPGQRPFSEPETVALREYFVSEPPDAVIFYHSALGAIFMGACDDRGPADWMGNLLSEATGYEYERSFDYYEVNGDASNWLAERGIPAAVVELVSRTEPEFDENLAGVLALQCRMYTDQPDSDLTHPDYIRLCE